MSSLRDSFLFTSSKLFLRHPQSYSFFLISWEPMEAGLPRCPATPMAEVLWSVSEASQKWFSARLRVSHVNLHRADRAGRKSA